MARSGKKAARVQEKELPKLPSAGGKTTFGEKIKRISLNLWLWELLGLLTSATCIGAILIILGHYNGKPVPEWNYGLTVNGVVSVLAVVAKASLILPIAEAIGQLKWSWYWKQQHPVMDFERFDSASRGPWGSLMMLCRPKMWNLGTLGALLTIAAIAIEPSLQQLPTYPLESVATGNSSSPRSVFYNDVNSIGIESSVMLDSGVKSTLFSGVFDVTDDPAEGITPDCSTGNCTWPAFTSLGVCSACQNVTNLLTFYNSSGLHSGQILPNGLGLEKYEESGRDQYIWIISGVYGTMVYNKTFTDQSILDLSLIYTTPSNSSNRTGIAYECVLYPCIKTFEASMENGSYEEKVTQTWPPPNTTLPGNPDVQTMNYCIAHGNASFCPGTQQSTCCSYTLTGNLTLLPPGTTETFRIALQTYNNLRYWLGVVMYSHFSIPSGSYLTPSTLSSQLVMNDLSQAFYINLLNITDDTVIWGGNTPMRGPEKTFESIAIKMTSRMRTLSKTGGGAGTAFSLKTMVHVRWWWAIFPLSLLVLTIAFLLLTVIMTVKKQVPIWKSSSLAPLLHGLDDLKCQSMTAHRFDHVESNAKAFSMGMEQDGQRWKLVGEAR